MNCLRLMVLWMRQTMWTAAEAGGNGGGGSVEVEAVSFRALGEASDWILAAKWDWWAIGRMGS